MAAKHNLKIATFFCLRSLKDAVLSDLQSDKAKNNHD